MPIASNQKLMYEIIENMSTMVRVMDEQDTITYMNKRMRAEFGNRIGCKCFEMLGLSGHCIDCAGIRTLRTKEIETKEFECGDKFYRIIASHVFVEEAGHFTIELLNDITDQKLLERDFLKHYNKLKGDISFAKQIQITALPPDKVYWNALRVQSAYLPSEDLGGDLFDILRVDEERCLFYIADVSGHGVRSALLTMFLRQVIRGMKAGAADLLSVIDELIHSYQELHIDTEQYISVLIGLYNMKTRALSLVNAGHNCLPLVVEQDNRETVITEIKLFGMPICSLLRHPNHEIKILQMEKGDRLLLYTDGIPEALNGQTGKYFGMQNLLKVIMKNSENNWDKMAELIVQKAKSFAVTSPVDDMAALVIEIL